MTCHISIKKMEINYEPSAPTPSSSGTPNSITSRSSSPTITLLNELLDEIYHFNNSHPFDTPSRTQGENVTSRPSSANSSISSSPNQSSESNTWSNTSSCLDEGSSSSSTCTQLRVLPLEYTQETLQRKSKCENTCKKKITHF